jgi:hypothetical protein
MKVLLGWRGGEDERFFEGGFGSFFDLHCSSKRIAKTHKKQKQKKRQAAAGS